jgi:hypothetical protein
LLNVNAMLGGFSRANENNWNVPPIPLFKNGILFDIHFTQGSAEFAQQGHNRRFGFFAEMAARPGVESYLAWICLCEARALYMLLHGFGLEYFWNGPAYG